MSFSLLFVFSLAFGRCVEAALLSQLFSARSAPFEDTSQRLITTKNTTTHLQTRQDTTKYVFMHHIVGNTYGYTVDDWKHDIQLIGSGGVDAIALNFGTDPWQNGQIQNAYNAASGGQTKLFLSFDFSVFPCDVNSVVNVVNQFANDGSQFKINGRPLISSYLGKCLGNAGWQQVKDRTGGYLMPFIAEIEGQFGGWNSLDSWFCWGCAWPQGNADKTTADDQYYLSQLGSTKYVAAVSPWMFTHYDYKNFYQRGDDWLIASRWEQLIGMRDRVAMVEMVTWNDFGESDYFGEIKGAQPSGTTWASGYSHLPFFELSKYYITAYKTGNYPAISEDVIYFWARPHPAQAIALADILSRPSGFDFAEDSLWVLVFATQSAQVTLSCGSSTQQFTVAAGANKLKIPLSPGRITVSMVRNGQTIINQSPSDFTYSSQPLLYNFNVYIGSAKASPGVPAPVTTSTTSSTKTSTSSISMPVSSASVPPSSVSVPAPPTTTIASVPPVTSHTTITFLPTPTPQAPWKYYGCVDEGTTGSRRALTGASYTRSDMTPEKCQTLCFGYAYAGVEYGQECYCGNSLTNNGATTAATSPSKCQQPCAGDPSKTCGGSWTLGVYTNTASTPPNSPNPSNPPSNTQWRSLGCYADSASRFLTGAVISRPGMTTEVCTTECSSRGYTFAATEYGIECYCGDSIKKNSGGAGNQVGNQECNMACDGNPSEKCGGSWRANVYTSSKSKRHLMKLKRRHT